VPRRTCFLLEHAAYARVQSLSMRFAKSAPIVLNKPFRSLRSVAALLVGLLVGSAGPISVAQQSCMGGMAMGSAKAMEGMQPVPAPEQLPVPIRMSGIGNSHISITATPEAQVWFDQGLNLMHDFWDYEAAKAFEQGIRVDPNCAMCWWGLFKIEGFRGGPERVYGTKALAEAVRLEGHTKGAEKLYIEAAQAASVAKDGDKKQQIVVLRKLVKKYPKDIEGRIFLAIAVEDGYDEAGEPKAGEKEGIAMLEGVLRDAPNDSAANHYWIHAIEPGNHPERAIPSATLLASLAPTSGHMVHMPGHIFYRVGNYPEAGRWFSASTTADELYMREQHVGPDDDWNYVHNMMYGIANLMEQGKLADANALSDRLAGARGQLSATLYIWSTRDQMARISRRLPVALRIGDWDAVLTLLDQAPLTDGDKTSNLRFLASELHDFTAGMRALERNEVTEAQAASARMDAGLWRLQHDQAELSKTAVQAKADPAVKVEKKAEKKDDAPMVPILPDAMPGPLISSLSVASLELQAGVLAVQGKLDAAKKLYVAAAKEEKALGYHEPPLYIRPVGETEAAILLEVKDYPGAKSAYEAALVERPDSGFGLYGLARVKELSGDGEGARDGYRSFLKAWPAADANLPEVTHAREVLGTQTLAVRDGSAQPH
jgi:tetratricopeptide (TPR) repeat protein